MPPGPRPTGLALVALLLIAPALPGAMQVRPIVMPTGTELSWRAIGPNQAGPVTAIAGDVSRPGVFFAASSGAGLWQTTDFGAQWTAVFDGGPDGNVTALALAPAGETMLAATRADAGGQLHRSDDGGASWRVVGAATPGPIAHIVVDPSDADRVFVTVAPDASDAGGGLYGSTNGGQTLTRILDAVAGWSGPGVFIHPRRTSHLIAVGVAPSGAGGPPLLFSRDAGGSWQSARGVSVTGRVLAVDLATAADDSQFLVVATDAATALYRSVDDGAAWTPVPGALPALTANARPRLAVAAGGWLLLAADGLFESRDLGRTFSAVQTPTRGGISQVWPHPDMRGVWLAAGPGGATVTVNAARTWSDPDNLPGAVVDRLVVDAAFPYRACATTVAGVGCAPAREASGPSAWQWLPRALADGVVPDPLDEHIVWGGVGLRYDRRTEQLAHADPTNDFAVSDRPSVPMAFSGNGRTLYAGTDRVWRTATGQIAWEASGPVLAGRNARISVVTVSAVDARTIWVGLDDGRVFVTKGGDTWTPATTPGPLSAIRAIEASRFDTSSAYVVTTSKPGTAQPAKGRLLRTRDEGHTWVDIGARIEGTSDVYGVREDPYRRGLLFAGTDRAVFVSFDDGERWQSLALNLPPTSVRDLAIRDADLLVATGGRGVWLLEDISPLRQVTADVLDADVFLFRPAQTWRVRAGDRPETAGRAPLTYALARPAGRVTIDVVDTTTGDLIRHFSSDPATSDRAGTEPGPLPTGPGIHRVAWDLRYPPPAAAGAGVPAGTPVVPGTYQVRLTVDGRTARQSITVRLDPRLRTSMLDLIAQRDLGRALDAARAAVRAAEAEPDVGPEVVALVGELNRLARTIQQSDTRPSASLEAAIESALARTAAAVATEHR